MSAASRVGVRSARVSLVSDEAYYDVARRVIQSAASCCFASVFIVDLNPHHDPETRVLQLLRDLRDAAWRGAEVKLLIGGSRENLAIAEACHIGRDMASSMGIDCRLLTGQERRGSHAKYVTADDLVLSGSHNWSTSALSGQIQDSLLVKSPGLASYMRAVFDLQWARSGEER